MRAPWFAAVAAIALVGAVAPAPAVIGVASAVRNDVRIRASGAPIARPAQLRQRVALADQVQTGAKSQLQLLLLDRSVFTVGANARLTIDRYVYDPGRGAGSVGATVTKGAFRFMSGRSRRTGGSSVNTPVASIGIRGTIFEGVVGESAALIAAGEPGVGRNVQSDPETASLIVLRGPGQRTQGGAPGSITVSAGGRTVALDQPLLAAYVPRPGAAPIGPFVISRRGLIQIQALLYPSVAPRLGWRGPADNLGSGEEVWTPPPTDRGPRPFLPGRLGPQGDASPGWNAPGAPDFGTIPQPTRPGPARNQPQPIVAPTPNQPPPTVAPSPNQNPGKPSPNNPKPTAPSNPTTTNAPGTAPSNLSAPPPDKPKPKPKPAPTPPPSPNYSKP